MITQVLVHKQSIQSRSVKTSQEHTHYNHQIYLFVFHPLGKVSVIILKLFAVNTIISAKHSVIVKNSLSQELFCTEIHCRWFKIFVRNLAFCTLFFIGSKRENSSNLQLSFRTYLQFIQFIIIAFGGIDTTNGKHGIKTFFVPLIAMCLNPEIL